MTDPRSDNVASLGGEELLVAAERSHSQAMDSYDLALIARRKGDQAAFFSYASEALTLESEAAWTYGSLKSAIEPGRTILFKGAAVIASELKRHQDVINLAGAGLSGCMDSELRQNLMRLLKQANFELEIFERDGISLSDATLYFSIDGSAIGNGYAREDVFRNYLEPAITLVRRTWQRLQGIEFNNKIGKDQCPIYISPAYGSLAVEFHLGEISQPPLPGLEPYSAKPEEVARHVVCGLNAVERNDLEELSSLIDDDVYRNNFLELSRRLLPKGDDVNVVKMVANTSTPTSATLTRRIGDQLRKPRRQKREPRIIEIFGDLLLADSLNQGSDVVGIRTVEGVTYNIKVPDHMMDDIVRPLWHKRVKAAVEVRPRGRGESRILVHCDEASGDAG